MAEVIPKQVMYCGICTFPPEFCEFGLSFARCKSWLQENNVELFNQLYSDEALANATSTLSIEKEEKISKDLQKKQQKEEARVERELQKKLSSKVVIKRIERNRRKHIISISGLDVFDLELKKLSKTLASKFATGCSIVKNAEKREEILVQGDVSDEAKEIIEKVLQDKGLDEVKVEQIDDKKITKKKAAGTPGAPSA